MFSLRSCFNSSRTSLVSRSRRWPVGLGLPDPAAERLSSRMKTTVVGLSNCPRTQNGHTRRDTRDVSRRIYASPNRLVCRRKRVACDRACTRVTLQNFMVRMGSTVRVRQRLNSAKALAHGKVESHPARIRRSMRCLFAGMVVSLRPGAKGAGGRPMRSGERMVEVETLEQMGHEVPRETWDVVVPTTLELTSND